MELINGRYELKSEIRRGGFGVTWYAWDHNLDMPVAIKEFSDPDPQKRSKFMKEARTLAQFSGSRGIVNVRDYLQTDDKVYMVMEYLDGEDLSTYVDKKGRLSLEETMELLGPVMDVLEKLHDAGMLHRDVSPDNIRLTSDGEVKLLDFGSATNMTSENLTRTITVKPGYAPVEQYSDAAGQGPWTDVYSLCATIYKCITGKKPADSLVRSFRDDLELPSAQGVMISPEEEEVLMKGLSVRPADRYDSVAVFSDSLMKAMTTSGKSNSDEYVSELVAKAFSEEPAEEPASNAAEEKPVVSLAEKAFSDDLATVMPAMNVREELPETVVQEEPAANDVREKPAESTSKRKTNKSVAEKTGSSAPSGKNGSSVPSGKNGKKKFPIPAILAGIAIIGLVVFFVVRGGTGVGTELSENVSYDKGSSYIYFKDMTITDKEIEFVKNNESITGVTFYSCQIPDEIIKRMAEWSKVEKIAINDCEGFSSLDPWADMPMLCEIRLNSWEIPIAGDQLFTREFPQNIVDFTILCGSIEGSTDFLRHFSGVKTLAFYVKENGNDMSFLEAMPNLSTVHIAYQTMNETACSHLSGHPDLKQVELNDTELANLDWAAECANIISIEAEKSRVTDLTPLADHAELEELNLSEAPVNDLSPLENCKKLQSLIIDHSYVDDLTALADHENLTLLNIDYCQVSDLGPLSNTRLHKLNAAQNNISSLKPLAGCTELESLHVNGNELTDLDGCQDMIKLTSLKASNNHIADISGIRNCSLIKDLRIANNEITDISPLDNDFKDLSVLDISDNEISDISALAANEVLYAIAADNNKISSIKALSGKVNLGAVFISNNEVTDISPLKDALNTLSYLDIGNNNVSDLSILKDIAVKNVWLLMENNNISDLNALPVLLQYRKLVAYGNPITDISFAEKMENISYNTALYLSYQENIDYEAIGRSKFNDNTTLVDVPSDKKASVLKSFVEGSSWREPIFKTGEEADAEMADYRKEIKAEIIGDDEETGDEETEQSPDDEMTEEAETVEQEAAEEADDE